MLLRKLSRINSLLPVDFIPALMMKFNYETVNQMNARYPEPAVVEAPSGVLDPNAVNGATVRVTYTMEKSDLILLSWNDQGDLVAPKYGSSSGTIDFLVPRAAVTDAAGKSIEVFYTVMRSGAAEPSTVLDLMVEAMRAEVRPHILNVVGASGPVNKGGITRDSLLTLSGMAGSGVTLDVFDKGYPVETILAESDGSWRLTLSGLAESEHIITVGNARGQLVSDPWPFTVISSTSGFEGFETIAPGVVPRDPDYIDFPSGLRLSTVRHSKTEPSIVRAMSQHGEHGFQYLFIPMADGGTLRFPGTPTSVKFTTWAARFVSDGLDLHMYLHGRDGVRFATLIVPVGRDRDELVKVDAPSGNYISSIQFGNDVLTGELALDSIYWSE
ncbi:hypothetical protein [Pseudomonas quasicaspiana]|uniref:hypothetical protein n=1 Tax=Pseudomonas quasicaspiana TaxID=2829821 RepID=UPI0011C3DEBE|nr:hypothetical protein [Pseudomonas quasicaspiana]MCD5980961.1 hypothetical protein [Pseudomonas quasicaspiana]